MEKVLNQEEIDRLVRKAKQNQTEVSGPAIEALQLDGAGKITSDQLSTISSLHEDFARTFGNNLSMVLRAPVTATLVAAEELQYEEFARRFTGYSYTSIIDLLPINGHAAAEMDANLVGALVDVSLGGAGRLVSNPHQVTEIEDLIVSGIMRQFCRDIGQAWERIGLEFRLLERQTINKVMALLPEAARALALSFEVSIAEGRGTLSIAIPSSVAHLLFRQWNQKRTRRKPSPESRRQLCGNLRGAVVPVSLCLPKSKLPAIRLAKLHVGEILKLEAVQGTALELAAQEFRLFSAQATRSGDSKAAKLTASAMEGGMNA